MEYVLIALSDPPEGGDLDVFNDWYTDQHIPGTLALPGFRAAQRYELADFGPGEDTAPRFFTVYELDSDSLEQVQRSVAGLNADREAATAEGRPPAVPAPPQGIGKFFTAYYAAIGQRIVAPSEQREIGSGGS